MVQQRPTPDLVAEIPDDEFPTADELIDTAMFHCGDHVVQPTLRTERDVGCGTAREKAVEAGLRVSRK